MSIYYRGANSTRPDDRFAQKRTKRKNKNPWSRNYEPEEDTSYVQQPQDYSQGYVNPYVNTPDAPVLDNASAQNSEQALREFMENNRPPQLRNRWDIKVYKPEWEKEIRGIEISKKQPVKRHNVSYANEKAKIDVLAGRKASREFDALVKRLEHSEEEYIFKFVSPEEIKANQGGVFHTDGDKLIIAYTTEKPNFGQGPLSTLFHETEHARQFEDGEIGFIFDEEKNEWVPDMMYDIVDEAKAWRFSFKAPDSDQTFYKNKFGTLKKATQKLIKMGKGEGGSESYAEATKRWILKGSPENGAKHNSFGKEPIRVKNAKQYHIATPLLR